MNPFLRWALLASATTVAAVYGAAAGREAARCLQLELDYRRTRDARPDAAIPLVTAPRVPEPRLPDPGQARGR